METDAGTLEWSVVAERDREEGRLALHKVCGSEGPSVLFVHGIEGTYDEWGLLAAHVAGRHSVYSLDLPWGAGGPYLSRASSSTPTEVLRAGLELLDVPPKAVIGHSFGANVLLRYLSETSAADPRYPEVAGAIAPFYLSDQVKATWEAFDRARRSVSEVLAQGMRVRLGERAARIDDELYSLMLAKVLDRIGPFSFYALFKESLASADIDLSMVEVPTLIVGGHDEELFTRDRAETMTRLMPSAEVHFRESLTHFCHMEQAPLLLDDIDKLLLKQLHAT